jgi:hypothetical protein
MVAVGSNDPRAILRVSAIVLNALFAVLLFAQAVVWGPNDYLDGMLMAVPPLLAVAALSVTAK